MNLILIYYYLKQNVRNTVNWKLDAKTPIDEVEWFDSAVRPVLDTVFRSTIYETDPMRRFWTSHSKTEDAMDHVESVKELLLSFPRVSVKRGVWKENKPESKKVASSRSAFNAKILDW